METLADLIVAALDEGPAILASEYPLGSYKGVNVDGLDPVKVAALHSSFPGEGFESVLGDYRPIAEASPSGPWLVRFPHPLIESLAGIAPPDMPAAAARWAATDAIRQEGWSEADAEKYLAQLVHFAQLAAFDGKEVYLCVYS